MLLGHLHDRALMPQVALRFGTEAIESLAIDEWMGASPVYTRRMRQLMAIDGDDVGAICKALQLDVGFAHQYMDVGYELVDDHHAEFWLNHCGALLDVEPMGEPMVIGMCHHIEDPTFDATAAATNPRARIRPVHRPPRTPADRMPHCRWTITIDPTAEPIPEHPLTTAVGALSLAAVPNERPPDREAGGRHDASGGFDPGFTLDDLAHGTLVAVVREFAWQTQLLSAAAELHLAARHGPVMAREVLVDHWAAASWVTAERLAARLGVTGAGLPGVLAVLLLHPAFPPGSLGLDHASDTEARFELRMDALSDPDAPGWVGLLARGELGAIAAVAHAVEPRAVVEQLDGHRFSVSVDADGAPFDEPRSVGLTRLSGAASWRFRDPEPVRLSSTRSSSS